MLYIQEMLAYILTKSVNVLRCQLWWGKRQNVNIISPCCWGKALTFTIWKQGLKVFPEISCKCGVERHFSGSLCLSNSVHSHSNSKGLFELEFSDIPSTFHCPTQITFNWSALQFQRISPLLSPLDIVAQGRIQSFLLWTGTIFEAHIRKWGVTAKEWDITNICAPHDITITVTFWFSAWFVLYWKTKLNLQSIYFKHSKAFCKAVANFMKYSSLWRWFLWSDIKGISSAEAMM